MTCAKCWADAYGRMWAGPANKTQADHYRELLEERENNPCTPQQQKHGYVDPMPTEGHEAASPVADKLPRRGVTKPARTT